MGEKYRGRREEMLNGPILKTLLSLGWPMALSNIFRTIYNLANTFWVAQLGSEMVAATTLGFPIMFLFMMLSMGLAVAGVSLVSQQIGAGREREKDEVAGQVYIFMLLFSLFVAVSGFLFADDILILLGGTPEVVSLGTMFLKPLFLGMPFMFTEFAFSALLRAHGETRIPMILTGITLALNLVLDPFFIFGWGIFPSWGLFGSAITDVIGHSIASLIGVFLLFSGKMEIQIKLHYLKPNLSWFKKIVKVGGPSSLGGSLTAIGSLVLTSMIARISTDAITVYGVGNRIAMMSNIAIIGVVSGLAPMIGQNIGAGQKERARTILKETAITLFVITLVMSLFIFLLRRPLYQAFIQEEAIIREGVKFLGIFAFTLPFFALFRMVNSVFQGSGHTKHSMMLSSIRQWGIRIFLSYLLSAVLGFGATGIWIGIALGNLLGGILSIIWVSVVQWEEKIIEAPRKIPA
ncbi:MAG: MATE family efflux transporter [Candidatus Bathyarchaeia archaeon]